MIWECTACHPHTHCRAENDGNTAPQVCLLYPRYNNHDWHKIYNRKIARRKLRATSILSIEDIAKSSRVCPDSFSKLFFVKSKIDNESEELAKKVEMIVLGVQV